MTAGIAIPLAISPSLRSTRTNINHKSQIEVFLIESDLTKNPNNKMPNKSLMKGNKMEKQIRIKPLGEKVLIKPMEQESKTKSGIIIPDTAKEKSQKGKILEVGQGKLAQDGEIKKGDKVLYKEYAGEEVRVEGENLIIASESDILAVINES